jgi:hypothetical protein
LDDLLSCPLLLLEYEKKIFKNLRATVPKAERGKRKKPRLPDVIRKWNARLVKGEYIPSGEEQAIFIDGETTVEVPRRAAVKKLKRRFQKQEAGAASNEAPTAEVFYKVCFDMMVKPVLVRRVYMEYFYPLDLLSYMKLNTACGVATESIEQM